METNIIERPIAVIQNLRKNIMGTTSFDMKIQGMRKFQNFNVYPITKDSESKHIITIQSNTRIGQLDLNNGLGTMSESHFGGAYFVHLTMDKRVRFALSNLDLEALRLHIMGTSCSEAGKQENGCILTDNSGAINI